MKRLALIVLLFLGFQSCSQAKKTGMKVVDFKTPPAPTQPLATITNAPEKYEPGANLNGVLMAINLKNPKDKAYNMKEFVNTKKRNIIILVKEGCVFCNSLLALLANKNLNANVLLVADTHTAFKDFVKKSKENKAIKAKWAYDYESKFATKLGMHSYPNILVLDKDLKVVEHQKGLRRLESSQQVEGLSFAAALQSMALNTVNWLSKV